MEMINGSFSVLMLPWLAHGHISPYLELAKRLAHKNLHIYLCSTPATLNSISKNRYDSIQFVEIHLPELPELPSHHHTTKGLPPHLMPTLKTAFDMAAPEFSNILSRLNPKVIIYDFLQPWAPETARAHNILAVEYMSVSAALIAYILHIGNNLNTKFPFPAIYIHDHERTNFKRLTSSDVDRVRKCHELSMNMILLRTFREIEDKYIDYASYLLGKKIVPVGALVQNPIKEETNKEITEFLNRKPRSSTVLISFGTEFFLSKDDMIELAHGLDLSGVNFIWARTFHAAEQSSIEEMLPEGFLNKIRDKDKGIVYNGFVPQKAILNHESVGGFVSHCGWGSVMESMRLGVPIIAMPMHLDQPVNARLVEEVGVGIEVKRGGDGRVCREEVGKVIREVVAERHGDFVRKRVGEVSEFMRRKGDEEIDGVVMELLQLCMKCNLVE